MLKNINKIESEWASIIDDYEFVGELTLTYDEYKHYSSLFSEKCIFLKTGYHPFYQFSCNTILVVLAVNCAYFEYDDDGFWIHFLSRIGLADRKDLQETLGTIIEEYLFKHKFIDKKREGPWRRFVGPILEQCGVTREYLPRFAEFLKTGADRYSWVGLITISKSSYDKLLPEEGMSSYLHKFLADSAGWKFVQVVARSIDQARQRPSPLKFLESVKGFRHSFWRELWALIETDIRKTTSASRINIPLPKLVYQPELNRLAILFDDSNVRLGNYMLDDKKVSHSSVELESKDDFKEVYSIKVNVKDSDWRTTELKGWSPEKRPYALFDAENGELLHPQKYLGESNYYLVISTAYLDGLSEQHKKQIENSIADFGWLALPFGVFRGILIAVEPATDLSFLGVDVDKKDQMRLVWDDNAKRLIGAEDLFDVFVGQLPDLIVTQPELFYENQLILMGDFGDGAKPIEISAECNKIKLDCSAPSKGEVWVEPVGRYREISEENLNRRLSFCCLPDCNIDWPDGLHKLAEEPVVEIKGDKNISVSFERECVAIDGDRRRWKMPQRQTFAEGTLTAEGDIFIRLARLIHRASLQDEHMLPLHSLTLEKFINLGNIVLTGYPDEQAKLFIRECGQNRPLAEFGRFDKTGKLKFNTSALKDTLGRGQFAAGQLCVEHYGKKVPTETRILNTQEIINRITLDDDFSWSDALSSDQKKALEELRKGITQRLTSSCLSVCDCLPEQLSDWGKEILYCASFFDGAKLEGLRKDFFPQDDYRIQAFKWLKMARSVSNAEKESLNVSVDTLLAALDSITWRPPIKRWENEFEKIYTNLKSDSELTGLLKEWKNEVVEQNFFVEYKSRIGQMIAGKELTNAWKYYMNNDFNRAYNRAKIAVANASPPVADLALILINILLLRNKTPKQVEDITGRHHRKLLPYIERSILFCKKASGKTFEVKTVLSDGVDIDVLPLNHEDVLLF